MKLRSLLLALVLMGAAPAWAQKISALPPATTPLAGTESVPCVQSGITDKCTTQSIANLAAGSYSSTAYTNYAAQNYGTCFWDAAHDVGPCINLAVAAAVGSGGGTVVLPAGKFGLATQVANNSNNIHFLGTGVGPPRDSANTSSFIAGTTLVVLPAFVGTPCPAVSYNCSGTQTISTPAFVQYMVPGGVQLNNVDTWGFAVDCASTINTGILIESVTTSMFRLGGAECNVDNIYIDNTPNSSVSGPGSQQNDYWLYSRQSTNAGTGVGIEMDAQYTPGPNISYNEFHEIYAWYRNGDGIDFGDSDNNLVDVLRTFPNSGTANVTSKGSPTICANARHTFSNGHVTKSPCRELRVLHFGGPGGIWVGGLQEGATLTATVSGAIAYTPITSVVPSPVPQNNALTVTFSGNLQNIGAGSAQSVDPREVMNCHSVNGFPGLFPNAVMTAVNLATVTLAGNVPYVAQSDTLCDFTWAIQDTYATNHLNTGGPLTSYVGYFTATPTGAVAGGHFGQSITAKIDNGSGGAGNILTISAIGSGDPIIINETITSGAASAQIVNQLTGTPGSTGTYTISGGTQNVASTSMTLTSCVTVPGWCNIPYAIALVGKPTQLSPQGTQDTGIQLQQAGYLLAMTDVVIPVSNGSGGAATPSNNDYFTITAYVPSYWTEFEGIDTGNSAPLPSFEHGATGYGWLINSQSPQPFGYSASIPVYAWNPNVIIPQLQVGPAGQPTLSASSWGNAGFLLTGGKATLTDLTSSGTIADEDAYGLAVITTAAASATTVTDLATLYVPLPQAGTNVTATNLWGIKTPSLLVSTGLFKANSGATLGGGTVNLNIGASANDVDILSGAGSGNIHANDGTGTGTIGIGNPAAGALSILTGSTNTMTSTGITAIKGSTVSINANAGTNGTNIGTGTTTGTTQLSGGSVRINTGLFSAGTTFTLTGGTGTCATTSTLTGGVQAGNFTATGATGTCAVKIVLPTAINGWTCMGYDFTHYAVFTVTAQATTGCTISVAATANDVIYFMAMGF